MMNKKVILIDADVVSHFIRAEEQMSIASIFPNCSIRILDIVFGELQEWKTTPIMQQLSDLMSSRIVKLMDFPHENEEIKLEYLRIKSRLFKGPGESACMAVARYTNHILASSNLRDIGAYCTENGIDYLTTMDFLCQAYATGLWDLSRCNQFISKVLAANGTLPVTVFTNHTCRDLSFAN